MTDTFTLALEIPLDYAIGQARCRLERYGGRLDGDTTAGTFAVVGVEGAYSAEGRTVTVMVTAKPLLIPAGLIRSVACRHMADIQARYLEAN